MSTPLPGPSITERDPGVLRSSGRLPSRALGTRSDDWGGRRSFRGLAGRPPHVDPPAAPPAPLVPGPDDRELAVPDGTDLAASVRGALSCGHFPLRSVVVVVTIGRVLLHGRVPTYYLKQVAQEAARRVSEGAELENRLVVDDLHSRTEE